MILEGIYDQESCGNNIDRYAEKSVKWLVNSYISDNGRYSSNIWTCNLLCSSYSCQGMVNIDNNIYSVSWLVAQSKILDSNSLHYPCHEGSTAGRAAFIRKNNVKCSDINTIMSRVYIQPSIMNCQVICNNKEYDINLGSMHLCDSQLCDIGRLIIHYLGFYVAFNTVQVI